MVLMCCLQVEYRSLATTWQSTITTISPDQQFIHPPSFASRATASVRDSIYIMTLTNPFCSRYNGFLVAKSRDTKHMQIFKLSAEEKRDKTRRVYVSHWINWANHVYWLMCRSRMNWISVSSLSSSSRLNVQSLYIMVFWISVTQ